MNSIYDAGKVRDGIRTGFSVVNTENGHVPVLVDTDAQLERTIDKLFNVKF